MGNVGHQQFWHTGSRFYFQRDPIGSTIQPIVDFGVMDTTSPNFEREVSELDDGDGGVLRTVDEQIRSIDETYETTGYNLNPTIMALLFSSDPPTALTQADTQKVDIKHYAIPGKLMKILDADYDSATATSDVRMTLGITSVDAINTAVSSGGTAYTEGDDWEVVSLERGLIRWLSTGDFSAAGEVYVTFTPRAISGDRLIIPQDQLVQPVKGRGMLVWARDNFAQQTARIARFSVTPGTPNLSVEDYSTYSMTLKVLSDINKTEPAGRLEYWVGDLPDPS